MTQLEQPLWQALIDPRTLCLVNEQIAEEKPKTVEIFSPNFLGELDILTDFRIARRDLTAGQTDYAERRLLCVQSHIERVSRSNEVGLACVFLCLGLVKQEQRCFYHAFGYMLHSLSVLERSLGSVNLISSFILNAIYALEIERGEEDRADVVRSLSRMISKRIGTIVPPTLSIWDYLLSQTRCPHDSSKGSPESSANSLKTHLQSTIALHGESSAEAARAARRLGATLYAEGDLSEARRFLEQGIRSKEKALDIRETADIYDLLVTVCEELDDTFASNRFRVCSRILRLYACTRTGTRS